MSNLMTQMESEMAHFSKTSSVATAVLQDRLMSTWQRWPSIKADFIDALNALPKDLRRHPFMKDAKVSLDAFEISARNYFSELAKSSRETYKNSLEPKLEGWATHLSTLQNRARAFSEQLSVMSESPIMQKFMRGEPILASRSGIQWARKFGHMALGLTFLWIFIYSPLPRSIIWTLYGAFMLSSFGLETMRHFLPRVNDWVIKAFRPVMREHEKNKINSAIYYMISMSLVFFFCPRDIAVLTMLFIAIADPVAGVIGVRFGSHRINTHASLEGTLACFITCTLLAVFAAKFLFTGYSLAGSNLMAFALLAGLSGALAEGSIKSLDDNLVMPLLSAPALWILLSVLA